MQLEKIARFKQAVSLFIMSEIIMDNTHSPDISRDEFASGDRCSACSRNPLPQMCCSVSDEVKSSCPKGDNLFITKIPE